MWVCDWTDATLSLCVLPVDLILLAEFSAAALYLLSGNTITQPELHCALSFSLITATTASGHPVMGKKSPLQ